MNKALWYISIAMLLIIAWSAILLPSLTIEINDDFSFFMEEEVGNQKAFEETFNQNKSKEQIIILKKENGWKTYKDYLELDVVVKQIEQIPHVYSVSSITNLPYPRKGVIMDKVSAFLPLKTEEAFLKRFNDFSLYPDITSKFLSKNKLYTLLFLKIENENNDDLLMSIVNQISLDHVIVLPVQYSSLKNDMEEVIVDESIILGVVSFSFIVLLFYFFTRSIRGLLLIGFMLLFNLSLVIILMVTVKIPLTFFTLSVPCFVIVLSFTDLMHIIYYQKRLVTEGFAGKELKKEILKKISIPMLITSLSNVVGFLLVLLLSDNKMLIQFAFLSIFGVAMAYLSSRFIALQFMMSSFTYIKKVKLPRIFKLISIRQVAAHSQGLFIGLIGLCVIIVLLIKSLFTIDYVKSDVDTDYRLYEPIEILQDNFFGTRQLKMSILSKNGNVLNKEFLVALDSLEKDIEELFEPYYIHGLVMTTKRYNRYRLSGYPLAYKLPNKFDEHKQKDFQNALEKMGAKDLVSPNKRYTYLTFGYKGKELSLSIKKYRELQKRFEKYHQWFEAKIIGKQFASDMGTYAFTWNLMGGLIAVLLIASSIIYMFSRSIKVALGMLLVNTLPVLVSVLLLLLLGEAITPLSIIFLSVLAGVCVDDSIYLGSHLFSDESKNQHLYPIVVTTVVMALGMCSLVFSQLSWMKPFALVFLVGLFIALILDVYMLPSLFKNREG